jgi:hypothetical protein
MYVTAPGVLFMKPNRIAWKPNQKNGKPCITKKMDLFTIPERLDLSEYHNYGEGSRVEYELNAVVGHRGVLMRNITWLM